MQFTPQQLVGAGRYNPSTRIGNWNEDLMLEEARLKEFQLRKKQGSLLAAHKERHEFLHQRVSRSFEASQTIHFGHAIGVCHGESKGFLAANVFEETPSIGSGEFVVTLTVPSTHSTAATASIGSSSSYKPSEAIARSTFRVVSPSLGKTNQASLLDFSSNQKQKPLCYGEPFMLCLHESLLVDDQSALMKPPLFLKSGLKSDRSMSPITYHQRVWLASEPDSSAVWTCTRGDLAAAEKFLACGDPVKAGDVMSIVHQMTGQPLFADSKSKQPTDFGVELEVCGFASRPAAKQHNLQGEKEGTRYPNAQGIVCMEVNNWTFVLANSAQEASGGSGAKTGTWMPKAPCVESIVEVMQLFALAQNHWYAFRDLVVGILQVNVKNPHAAGCVDREDLKWHFMRVVKFPLREEHYDLFFDALDKKRMGHVPLDELLQLLRRPAGATRRAIIEQAFDALMASSKHPAGSSSLTVNEICEAYDPSVDPRVASKQLTKDQALEAFRALWLTTSNKNPAISKNDFVQVYADISFCVAQDQVLQQLLEESWRR